VDSRNFAGRDPTIHHSYIPCLSHKESPRDSTDARVAQEDDDEEENDRHHRLSCTRNHHHHHHLLLLLCVLNSFSEGDLPENIPLAVDDNALAGSELLFFIPTSCCWGPLLPCWSVGGGAWDGPKYAAIVPRFSILLTIGKGIHPLRIKSACKYASVFPGKHVTVQQGEPSSVVVVVGKKKKKSSSVLLLLLLMMSINSGGALC